MAERIASQIAAGEVVERPASVVKELVENALDAGAGVIRIEISDGGLEQIVVIDDGCGMDRIDAELALQRHATSKISEVSDLETVGTLGFRGEALPSIAAVSRLTLKTRPAADSAEGTVLEVEGGKILRIGVAGGPPGTTVMVGDLFYNTPARKKFIRSASRERAVISEMVGRLALSRPEIAFRLISNGRQVLATSGSGDLLDTVASVLGGGVAREMLPVRLAVPGMELWGCLGRPGTSRSTRRHQVFFVNGRYIRSSYLAAAVGEALRGVNPAGRHPVLVFNLVVDPVLVDVNVHPAKYEVRFSRPREVYSLVSRAVRQAVGRSSETEMPEAGAPFGGRWSAVSGQEGHGSGAAGMPEIDTSFQLTLTPELIPEASLHEAPTSYSSFPKLQLLGLLPPSYFLACGDDGLYIVDQHTAHERILYERFLAALQASQGRQLVIPATVEIGGREAGVLDEYRLFLQRSGFEIETFGEESFIIRAVPAFLKPGEEVTLLLNILERLAEEKPVDAEASGRVLAAVLACHRAIRSGQKLADEEMEELLAGLARAREPYFCPHGRPTLIKISFRELAQRFRRG